MKIRQFSGYLVWVTGESPHQKFEIKQGILRDDSELAIDCNCPIAEDPNYVYTIVLKRKDSITFEGRWTVGKSAEQYQGECSCRLYSNGQRLSFVGRWDEDGVGQIWFGELYPG